MSKFKIIILFIGVLMSFNAVAQPSNSELKAKVYEFRGSSEDIVSFEFAAAKIEKRWVKNQWKYYWSRGYIIKTKTEYSGVYLLSNGGVQYLKTGNSYSYDRILLGAPIRYEGIPNPTSTEINAHLKSSYDPLNFYDNYLMNYLIEAPNNIKLTDNPDWKWRRVNEVSCNVEVSFTRKTDDIGGVKEQKGVFRIALQRSLDGITYNPEAKLLKNGKWLPVAKGQRVKFENIRSYNMSKEELKSTRTLAQKNATRHAEEFKKSLAIVTIPEFKSANHLMQFTHELLLEGDEAKVTAFMYQMFPRSYFEEWSDIVLNQTGERLLGEAIEDLPNYKKAFCQYPVIKDIGSTYVNFYDRNKRRFNRIHVSYVNNRWYVTEIGYTIRDEDFDGYKTNADSYCDGNSIFIDGEPQFKTGDKVLVLVSGTWFDGEILKPEMEKGGYSVKYGRSGLLEWKFVSEVKENPEVENTTLVKEEVKYEIGEKVSAKYTGVWYEGTVLKHSYEKEGYLIDIPARNIDTWVTTDNLKKIKVTTTEDKQSNEPKVNKPKIKIPKVKIKLR